MFARRVLVSLVLLVLGPAGLPAVEPEVTAPPIEGPSRRGIVFIVAGVGGWDILGPSATLVLPKAGVKHEIRDFVWTHGFGHVLKDLQDTRHVVRKAGELAERIRTAHELDPDRPIFVVARSGGAGLALLAAEQLPANTLERIILLSGAVSPEYDLRPALRSTRKEIVSFYSRHDQLVLNWGTRQFGTIDRVYGPSAGLAGFQAPVGLNEEEVAAYGRLVQVPWNARMFTEGNTGGHLGTSLPTFLAVEVAPWLR